MHASVGLWRPVNNAGMDINVGSKKYKAVERGNEPEYKC